MKVAVVCLVPPDRRVRFSWVQSAYDIASELRSQGAQVALVEWRDRPDACLPALSQQVDRILLWDADALVDLAATRFALGEERLLDALDRADVVTAACMASPEQLAVFSGAETFALPRPDLGTDLMETMARKRRQTVCAAFGAHWVWINSLAVPRMTEGTPQRVVIAGVDCTLSRRLIEGGCSVVCDPRIAVTSYLQSTTTWCLPPPETVTRATTPEGEPQAAVSGPAAPASPA